MGLRLRLLGDAVSNEGRLVRARLKFERDFTQIPNEWMRDPDLSLKARGLLGLLMTHETNFSVTVKALVASNPEGRDAIDGALKELRARDYLRMDKERNRQGHIVGITWTLTDPVEVEKSRSEPLPGFPTSGKTHIRVNRELENPRLKEDQVKEHLSIELKNPTIGARADEEDALPRGSHPVASESPAERYERLIHLKCPGRKPGKPHVYNTVSQNCEWCGLRNPQAPVLEDELELVATLTGAHA